MVLPSDYNLGGVGGEDVPSCRMSPRTYCPSKKFTIPLASKMAGYALMNHSCSTWHYKFLFDDLIVFHL